ncbi:MAG: gliding motility-associated C-terminal domain-containing protein [Saprospiraceae bacterium]|nr:gliding motility-associated C-terminal domain-containing protein [Lewinella sp.]
MIRNISISIVFLLGTAVAFPQTFLCDHTFYVIMQENGESRLYNFRLEEGNELRRIQIPLSEPQRRYTCLGMSIEDLYMYALDYDTKELLRIDASGKVTSLGVPDHLDIALEYVAGDVMPEGRRLFVVGRDKASGRDKEVYSINLTVDNYYAGSAGLVSNYPTYITDLATDPITGVTYGYDKANKQLVVLGTNNVSHHNHQKIEPAFESLFFDEKGNLYGYGSNAGGAEQSTLYAIDKVKGGATRITSNVAGQFGDGCSCPATMTFTRTIRPDRVFPCSEVTIDYRIVNHSGIGKTDIVFEDVLPPEWTIAAVEEHTFTLANIEKGVGGNELYIPILDVLIGENIIRTRVRVNSTAGRFFETQASMENLPLGLGGTLLSDNPITVLPDDPNLLEVLPVNSLELEDLIRFNCTADTAFLSIPSQGDADYLWSDGSTGEELSVTQPGLYWVQVKGDCFAFSDSILIEAFPEPAFLDLGPDLQLKEGTQVTIPVQTSADAGWEWEWESSGTFELSCRDCTDPDLLSLEDNMYTLRISDGGNCELVDSLRITVVPVRDLYVPNAFSPNGDGVNDVFYIQGSIGNRAQVNSFRIFDRWGSLVFERRDVPLNDPTAGWDGRGISLGNSTELYIWIAEITLTDGTRSSLSGEVSVLR